MKLYYDFENDEFLTEEELFSEYQKSDQKQYYKSFCDYKNACLHLNNGSLYTIEEHIAKQQSIIKKCTPAMPENIEELMLATERLYKTYEFIREEEENKNEY